MHQLSKFKTNLNFSSSWFSLNNSLSIEFFSIIVCSLSFLSADNSLISFAILSLLDLKRLRIFSSNNLAVKFEKRTIIIADKTLNENANWKVNKKIIVKTTAKRFKLSKVIFAIKCS